MLFLNTRPADRAADLTQFLQARQIDVLDLPLLELSPMPWSEDLAALYAALASVQVIVAVSPSAVQYGMEGLKRAGLTQASILHIQWIVVGEATAKALQAYGLSSHVPLVETSEGMLDLPVLHQLDNTAKVAFWRGEGGRQFMMDTLRKKGVQLLNFVLYRRQCPEQAPRILMEHLLELQGYCMLVTSEASWLNWLRRRCILSTCPRRKRLNTWLRHATWAYLCLPRRAPTTFSLMTALTTARTLTWPAT